MISDASADVVDRVDAALGAHDPYGARQLVEEHVGGLPPGASGPEWARALDAIVRLAELWADEDLATAARRAAADPLDGSALYAVGHRLVDTNVLLMAEPVLSRAVHIAPTPETVAELVAVLELQGRYEDAKAALERTGVADRDPLCSFLLAFSSAMLFDLEPARSRVANLRAVDAEPFRTLAASLEGMVRRADALGDHGRTEDLRVWHFIWTGGVLLAPAPTRRRQTLVGWADLRRAVAALGEAHQRVHLGVDRILAAPDHGSQILGLGASTLLELPLETWRGEDGPGLLVVHNELDLDLVLRPALRRRSPGQALYVHLVDAAHEQPAAGDFTGTYGLGLRAPWQGGVDGDGEYIGPEEGDVTALAGRLLDAPCGQGLDPDTRSIVDVIASTGLVAAAVANDGSRSRQWVLPAAFRTA